MRKLLTNNLFKQIFSLVFILLALTIGLIGIIHYDGALGRGEISAYTFANDNSKQSQYVDYESAKMLEAGQTDSGDYVCKVLVSNERNFRTDASAICSLLSVISIAIFVSLLLIDLVITTIKFFGYYQNRFNLAQLIIKASEALFVVFVCLSVGLYLSSINYSGTNFSLGFSFYVLIVLGILSLTQAFLSYFIKPKKEAKLGK
ncbi:MAG: hypothetical protein J5689_03690 [Clostridia bacterium]|nr:hypothetical protein [Clostridia bacterium]